MRNDVAVVILAGGEGRRIGGGKPLRIFAGERLIDRAVNLARRWSDLVAVAVRDRSQIGSAPVDLIPDEAVAGPLGGLISGLKLAAREQRAFLLVIPADMPFLPPDLLDRLGEAIGDHRCALAASDAQLHPVCGLWRADAVDWAASYTGAGRRSLKGFAASVGFVAVEWPSEPVDPFFNINTSDDLAEAARRGA